MATDLKTRYYEAKDRSDMTIREYLTQCGYTGDEYNSIVDRLLAEAAKQMAEGHGLAEAVGNVVNPPVDVEDPVGGSLSADPIQTEIV